MNKILVTGANGFIGKTLVSHLNNLGRNVVPLSSVDGNIADRVTLAKFLKQDIVHVYHLAAKTFVPSSLFARVVNTELPFAAFIL